MIVEYIFNTVKAEIQKVLNEFKLKENLKRLKKPILDYFFC